MKKNILLFLILSFTRIFAQNQITGYVESVPDKIPAFARVTLTNTANESQKYIALTNPSTGVFEIDVPNGTYTRKVEVQDHFLYTDTKDINSSQQMDFQIIKDIGSTSTYHPNILNVVKTLTATLDGFVDPEIERWNDSHVPIPLFANRDNIPSYMLPYLNSALDDIITKSDGKVQYNEVNSDPEAGIAFEYRKIIEMPAPGSGYTQYDSYFPDESPKHITIFIATDNPEDQYSQVFRKELMRAMPTFAYSQDPSFIMSFASNPSVLHPDEGKALQIMYTLKHNTDMRGHKEIVINDPVPVELTTFNAIKNNNIVDLLWNTATEVNNYGFDIERKKDKWEKIGFVEGHGNSNSPKAYEFKDTVNLAGIYSYRLKQLDIDGQFDYSPEVKVDLTDIIKAYELMQNYPNPFNPETRIRFNIPEKSTVTLAVYNSLGEKVKELLNNKTLNSGIYEETFNGKDFASGMYLYRLDAYPETGEHYTKIHKMILVK